MAQLRSQHLGNAVGRDVTLDGSGSTTGSNVWYALPAARREAIGLILLYSDQMWNHSISVTTTKKDNNPNVPLRIATQFLIYEIVCGLRNPTTFESNSTNECGTSGDIFSMPELQVFRISLPTTMRLWMQSRQQRRFPALLPHPAAALLPST